jgi:hypothetical protein
MGRIWLWVRGYRVTEGEIVDRWLDQVFEGVKDLIAPLVQLAGDLELYLSGLAFRDACRARGLAVCFPEWVASEIDIYWAHVARLQFPNPVDGSRLDILAQLQAYPDRYPLYHVKDGVPNATGTNLTFTDVGDGIIAAGDPFYAPSNFRTIFDEAPRKGWHLYIQERDNAPGGSLDPGRSFRSAQRSAEYMIGLRAESS